MRWIATRELRYLVSAPPEGGRRPALGFYPIFALSVLASTKLFWLRANVRARTGQGWDRAIELFETVTKKSFSQRGGNFKEFGLLATEAPVACLYILMMSAKLITVKNYDTEAPRAIAGA